MPKNDFDFGDVFDSSWGSSATGGTDEIATLQVRPAGDADGQTADDVELWGHACFAYRPADPTDDGKCQVLMVRTGGRQLAIGSRDLRSQKAFGELNKGDAVFGSPTGGVTFKSNADGSGGIRRSGVGDDVDPFLQLEADGTWLIGNQWGQLEIGEGGLVFHAASGETMQLGAGAFSVSAPTGALQCGSIGLGVGAIVPLAAAPITGVVGVGFVSALPITSIFVPPG